MQTPWGGGGRGREGRRPPALGGEIGPRPGLQCLHQRGAARGAAGVWVGGGGRGGGGGRADAAVAVGGGGGGRRGGGGGGLRITVCGIYMGGWVDGCMDVCVYASLSLNTSNIHIPPPTH